MIDEYYTFKIFGYHSDDLSYGSDKRVAAVCDDCGLYRSIPIRNYHDTCKPCADANKGAAISTGQLRNKEPLSDGWESKLSDITTNKESATYLGSIAETILSRIYDSVQVMPNNNHGFDVICNKGFKIDIKSSATGYKGYWPFSIGKNQIADFFLCLAFESRDDLYTPVHLWLIPGHIVNHLASITIYKTTVNKWSKYELPLDKLLMCCDNLL